MSKGECSDQAGIAGDPGVLSEGDSGEKKPATLCCGVLERGDVLTSYTEGIECEIGGSTLPCDWSESCPQGC